MLNNIESLKKIKSLLDHPEVYKYSPIEEEVPVEVEVETSTGTEIVTSTGIYVITIDEQFDADIVDACEDVYIDQMINILATVDYELIQDKEFEDYTENEKRFFLIEAYLTAAQFLENFAFKYETEMYKSTVDFQSKVSQVETSGKIYSAKQYRKKASSLITKLAPPVIEQPFKKHISISRY